MNSEKKFKTVNLNDNTYPALLKEIFDPPPTLMTKGVMPDIKRPHLAVVGSRKASPYGKEATRSLVGALARAGVVIVSGLAYGIDQAAHKATMDAGGTTVAVLGFGIDFKCTYREQKLRDNIIKSNGAIISEFQPKEPGHKSNFPKRNRVISGICQGTLIIEAAERSGSLITARMAMQQNRDVFAVPGPITSQTSKGTNNLLKDGAFPVTCAKDILRILGVEVSDKKPSQVPNLSAPENTILNTLSDKPTHIDDIARANNSPINVIAVLLTSLEIAGHIKDIGGGNFVIK
ncbi:DNA-protecting protein DprA [Candidatus Uhrbacteria bacterium]|jgi:DNA processing protein|nr:DNA-protecting protein DprA [Candidatus Uhrbacteria bacterium]